MKKILLLSLMGIMGFSANAQLNYTVQTACHPALLLQASSAPPQREPQAADPQP